MYECSVRSWIVVFLLSIAYVVGSSLTLPRLFHGPSLEVPQGGAFNEVHEICYAVSNWYI